jgi:limonene-1,2-epoxide hydrolase
VTPDSAETNEIRDVSAAFRAGIEATDMDSVVALLADDVVFNSPIVFASYHGRDGVGTLLRAVATVFEDFRYTAEYGSPDGHALAFSARVGDRTLDGVDILRVESGKIVEFTVMVRPYSAATALRDRMATLLT